MTRGNPRNGKRKSRGVTTYSGIHAELRRVRGYATEHVCECGRQAYEWAYTHDNPCPDERLSRTGCKYSLDVNRYKPLCRRCHRLYDKQGITECPYGHQYTPENTIIDAGKRKCKTCVYERNAQWRKANQNSPEQRKRKNEYQRAYRARQREK